ncbi:MAG: hypothetical protein WC076_13140 [Terrimicrobiaceae bacterium]|nr:hypothetical protein [Terrimicrobiaceae bacterium]
MSAGAVAGLSGLLMGIGMNAVGARMQDRKTAKTEAAFGALDKHFTDLQEAVRSPEALAKFNGELEKKWIGMKPDSREGAEARSFVPLSMESAADMLGSVEKARNAAALQVLLADEKLVDGAIAAIDPKADKAKLAEAVAGRPAVLAQAVALGRDMAPVVAPGSTVPPGPLKHAIIGHIVLGKMQEVLKGGKISADLGQALEQQGFLIQKPAANGGTRWVFTAPALELMDGDIRRAVAKNPKAFAVDLSADTSQPGKLAAEVKSEGDAAISSLAQQGAGAPPALQTTPAPAGQQSYTVTLQSEPDKAGYTTRRKVTVNAASPEEAGAAAAAQATKWKGTWNAIEAKLSPDSAGESAYPSANGQEGSQSGTGDALGEGGAAISGPAEGGAVGGGQGEAVPGPEPGGSQGDGGVAGNDAPSATVGGEAGGVRGDDADRSGGVPGSDAGNGAPVPGSPAADPVNTELAGKWDALGRDIPLLKKALAKLDVKVTNRSTRPTMVVPDAEGNITLNLNPADIANPGKETNSTVDEELRHVGMLVALRKDWEAGGKAGPFTDFLNRHARETFNDLLARLNTLQ